MKTPLVSVVITTKNEESNIVNCLESIIAQTYKNLEIIVVDNHSIDQTRKLAKQYTKHVFDLAKITHPTHKIKNFRGAQVNLGVQKSSGKIIFFPDADMTFDYCLIEEAVDKLKNHDALYVPEQICGQGFFGKIRNFERSFYNQTCVDGIRIISKQFFTRVSGFDTSHIVFGPDDWDFTKAVKKNHAKLGITINKIYHHEEQLTVGSYLTKKSQYVDSFSPYIKKWGRSDSDIKKQFGFYYRYFGVFLENGKWKKLLSHPLLSAGMYFMRFMVGVSFLMNKK